MESAVGGRATQDSPIRDERDDGIAMALLEAARDLDEVKERIQNLVNAHAMRVGVTLAA